MKEPKEVLKLRVSVSVEKFIDDGQTGGDAYLRQTGERLSVNEELSLPAMGFIEVAKVIGQFHDLAESIKKQVQPK